MGRQARALAVSLALGLALGLTGCGNDDEAAELRDKIRVLQAEKQADQDAVKAAKAFVATVTTYSYKPGEHDFAWVEDLQNEKVRKQFEERVADLKKAIETSKTSAKGQVVDAAGRVVDETQVEVLAFVDQAITDPSGKVNVEESSINLTMKLVDGKWEVDTLTFLNKVGS